MRSILKKSNDAADKLAMPAWHPNFRDAERLPDTKVVRTSFFINGAAVLVTVCLLLSTLYREYTLWSLDNQIEATKHEIEVNRPVSAKAIAQFKVFQAEEQKVLDLKEFMGSPINVADFMVHLGETMPENITLTQIDSKPSGVVLRGIVRGAPERASGEASAYVEQLRKDPTVGGIFKQILLTNVNRDATTGELVVEFNLSYAIPKKGGK